MTKNTQTVTISLYTDNKVLDAKIAALHKAGQKMQTEMHKLACSVVAQFGENKDVRVATAFVLKLAAAMPEMSRVNALKAWFEAHAPIKFATPEELKAGASAAVYVRGGKFKLGDAMAKPFWKFAASEGKPYEALDMDKFVSQIVAKLNKDATETGADHSDLLNALKGYKQAQPSETQQARKPMAFDPAKVTVDPLAEMHIN